MADILTAGEIDDIRASVAPEATDELVSTVEVWRRPSVADGTVAGGAGVDQYGTKVTGATGNSSTVPTKIGTYPARITRAGAGAEVPWGDQAANVNKYTVSINWALSPDVQGGDNILETATGRSFEVVDAGGATTFKVLRMVRVQEVL
jgi:hypothetical protein